MTDGIILAMFITVIILCCLCIMYSIYDNMVGISNKFHMD